MLGSSSTSLKEINGEIEKLKKSVSDGKAKVAKAITDNGEATAADASFQTMADNVGLMAGIQYNAGVTDADARVNTNSANYKAGYNTGVTAADGRVNTSSTSYQEAIKQGFMKYSPINQMDSADFEGTNVITYNISDFSTIEYEFGMGGGTDSEGNPCQSSGDLCFKNGDKFNNDYVEMWRWTYDWLGIKNGQPADETIDTYHGYNVTGTYDVRNISSLIVKVHGKSNSRWVSGAFKITKAK